MIGVECFEEVGAGSVGTAVLCRGSGTGAGQSECVDRVGGSGGGSVVHEESARVGGRRVPVETLRREAVLANGVGWPKMNPAQWNSVKFELRLRLDTWARIIVFRAQNPGELYPQMAHWEERSPGWKKRHPGAMVNALMSEFVEIETALRDVPGVIQGIWLRMYGGASVIKDHRKVIRTVAGDCDVEGMMVAVNAWEARVADRLGILSEVMG